jgi:DNA polymerase-4
MAESRRVILHVDMDAFFASIVQLDEPALRGQPVLVGHDGPRGVVTAASYEARPFGCRSAMPMAEAKRRCPQAVVVGVPGERVREMSWRLFDLLGRFSPLVQPMSVDEAFVDLTGAERLFGDPAEAAERLRAMVREELGLTASVGVAPNKFLAKLASDLNKPDGLTLVPFDRDEAAAWLAGMPIGRLWGIGPKAEQRLGQRGIRTIGDLQRTEPKWLAAWFGEEAEHLRRLAFGLDERPVVPDHQAKSIGHEQTFGQDLTHPQEVLAMLADHVEQVGWRVRRHGLTAGRVTVKIRFGEFQTITRSTTLEHQTDRTAELWRAARELFERWSAASFQPVRLIGVSAGRLSTEPGQMDLFGEAEARRQQVVDHAVDRILDRFGKRAIRRGTSLR